MSDTLFRERSLPLEFLSKFRAVRNVRGERKEAPMPAITPSLWFDDNLEEAAEFYISVFPNSSVEVLHRTTDAGPGEPGRVLSGFFVLDGMRFIGINGGPHF